MFATRLTIVIAVAAITLGGVACLDDDRSRTPAPTIALAKQAAPVHGTSCSYNGAISGSDSRQKVVSNGVEREYVLHVPTLYAPSYDGLAPAPAPLLIAFHGAGVPAQSIIDLAAIPTAGDRYGVVTVFPEATAHIWNVLGSPASTVDSDFVADLVAEVSRTLCIDVHRVYAAGFSLGGSMALLLGCTHADLLAAIAVVAAPYQSCQGDVPLVAFHGDSDPIALYKGADERRLPPVEAAVADWAQALGCDAAPAVSRTASDVDLAAYGRCASGREDALLYTVRDGGHAWPGAAFDFPREITGRTTHSISATEIMFAFFLSRTR